jgi:outer membrane autotransporter protein
VCIAWYPHRLRNHCLWQCIGKSNGAGANKTEFNLKSLNIGMDRRIAQDKTIGFALGLGKQDRTATGSDFSGDVIHKTIGTKTAFLLVFMTNI